MFSPNGTKFQLTFNFFLSLCCLNFLSQGLNLIHTVWRLWSKGPGQFIAPKKLILNIYCLTDILRFSFLDPSKTFCID